MRAFLETVELVPKSKKDYFDDFVYTSKYQLLNLGVETIDFDGSDLKSLDKYTFNLKTDILIGSVEATCHFFKSCGIEPPSYIGYPEELKKYLHRNVAICRVKDLPNKFPYFIKPKNDVKLFTGTLCDSETQLRLFKAHYPVTDETELYLSDPVEFLSEYRCFVYKGKLMGIHWYSGDFKLFPDVNTVESIIKDYKSSNVSYTLDVGIVKDSNTPMAINYGNTKYSTILIEVNDMWAIGSYGFNPKDYVRMTIDRFQEIYKNSLVKT